MSSETEKLVFDFFAALDAFELDRAYSMVSPDFAFHPPGAPAARDAKHHHDAMFVVRDAFADYEHKVVEQFSCGDRVATRFVFSGVMKRPYRGIPATGERISVGGVALDTVIDGKITKRWVQLDLFGLVDRVGAKVVPK